MDSQSQRMYVDAVEEMRMRNEYEKSIDELIPYASDEADIAVGVENANKPEYAAAWTLAFHEAMDRMTAVRGIRRASYLGPRKPQ